MSRLYVALALLLAGCGDSSDSQPAPSPSESEAPPAEVHYLVYHCDRGADIRATYPDLETAVLLYDGQTHQLDFLPASPKNGAEYADSTWSWLTSRSAGVLTRVDDGAEVERCEQEA